MPRTDAGRVQGVLLAGKDYDAARAPDLSPYITWANLLMNRVVACALDKGLPIDADTAAAMETWLAAHAYQQSDKGYSERVTGIQASGVFQGKTAMYLESTFYGQSAVLLDPSGCLTSVAQGGLASADGEWLGKTLPEQATYEQRN